MFILSNLVQQFTSTCLFSIIYNLFSFQPYVLSFQARFLSFQTQRWLLSQIAFLGFEMLSSFLRSILISYFIYSIQSSANWLLWTLALGVNACLGSYSAGRQDRFTGVLSPLRGTTFWPFPLSLAVSVLCWFLGAYSKVFLQTYSFWDQEAGSLLRVDTVTSPSRQFMLFWVLCSLAALMASSRSLVEGWLYPGRWCFPSKATLSPWALGVGYSGLSLLMRLSSPQILSWIVAILLTRMSKQRFLAFSRFPSPPHPRNYSLPPSSQRSLRSLPSLLGWRVLAVSLRGVREGVLGTFSG